MTDRKEEKADRRGGGTGGGAEGRRSSFCETQHELNVRAQLATKSPRHDEWYNAMREEATYYPKFMARKLDSANKTYG